MLNRIVEHKICANCKIDKPSTDFDINKARVDGLKYLCKKCDVTYVPQKHKRSFENVIKECGSCRRTLSSRCYGYDQHSEDRLQERCRTCRMRRDRSIVTAARAEALEREMQTIYKEAMVKIGGDFTNRRGEFEQYVYKGMVAHHLTQEWKVPLWLHKTSLPD